jgi:hypothetical protein
MHPQSWTQSWGFAQLLIALTLGGIYAAAYLL